MKDTEKEQSQDSLFRVWCQQNKDLEELFYIYFESQTAEGIFQNLLRIVSVPCFLPSGVDSQKLSFFGCSCQQYMQILVALHLHVCLQSVATTTTFLTCVAINQFCQFQNFLKFSHKNVLLCLGLFFSLCVSTVGFFCCCCCYCVLVICLNK